MNKLDVGQLIAMAAALLVLVFFFFPWIEINMLLAATNLSGFQLAAGNGPAGANFPGVPSLLLVPLSMLGVLALVAFSFLSPNTQLKTLAAVFFIGAGAISGLIIIYQYLNLNQELNQNILGM